MSASKILVACWLGLALLSVSTVLLGNAGATLALTAAFCSRRSARPG